MAMDADARGRGIGRSVRAEPSRRGVTREEGGGGPLGRGEATGSWVLHRVGRVLRGGGAAGITERTPGEQFDGWEDYPQLGEPGTGDTDYGLRGRKESAGGCAQWIVV